MSTNDTSRHELVRKAMDGNAGTWDAAGINYLEDGAFLAYVADGPVKARQESAELVGQFLKTCAAKLRPRLSTASRELTALLLADIVTSVGQNLLIQGAGAAYVAAAFAIVTRDAIYVLTVGDCAVYIVGDDIVRLSEATRVAGGSVLSVLGGATSGKADAFQEASYLGAALRAFTQSDVTVLPCTGVRALVLVSDGAEQQLGVDRFAELIRTNQEPADIKRGFNELLTGTLVDDVTMLAVRLEGARDSQESLRVELLDRCSIMEQRLQQIEEADRKRVEDIYSHITNHGQWIEAFEDRQKTTQSAATALTERLRNIETNYRDQRRTEGEILRELEEKVRKLSVDVATSARGPSRESLNYPNILPQVGTPSSSRGSDEVRARVERVSERLTRVEDQHDLIISNIKRLNENVIGRHDSGERRRRHEYPWWQICWQWCIQDWKHVISVFVVFPALAFFTVKFVVPMILQDPAKSGPPAAQTPHPISEAVSNPNEPFAAPTPRGHPNR